MYLPCNFWFLTFVSMTIPLPEEHILPLLPPLPGALSIQVFKHSSSLSSLSPQSYDRLLQRGASHLQYTLTCILYDHPSSLDSRLMTNLLSEYVDRDNVAQWGIQYGLLERVDVAGGS